MKLILGTYFAWDRRSDREKAVAYYRFRNIIATVICLIPFPIGGLLSFFGSDKERKGGHHYGPTYRKFLRRFRYRPIKFLEIGIGGYDHSLGGSSLLAWQAFFPLARIVACDIVPKPELATLRTKVYVVDQSSAEDLARLIAEQGPFDVVVDDGSHLNAHQIFAFRELFDAVTDGGLYVIEDVQTSFWQNRVGPGDWDGRNIADPEFSSTCVGFFLELAKYLNHREFRDHRGIDAERVHLARAIRRISFEHNMILVEKGYNDAPSNVLDAGVAGPESGHEGK